MISILFHICSHYYPPKIFQSFCSFCITKKEKKEKQKKSSLNVVQIGKNEMPKYSLHFVQPCHFQVPSSFQASVVEHNFCPLFVFISVIFVPQHI